MDYRIIDLAGGGRGVEVRRYDSAYEAMDALRAAVRDEPERARYWHLVDSAGRVLLRPDDVEDLAA